MQEATPVTLRRSVGVVSLNRGSSPIEKKKGPATRHPGRYAADVGTIVGAEVIGGPVGGLITAVHALHSAYELEKEVH